VSRLASLVTGVARSLADRPDEVHVVETDHRAFRDGPPPA
jgi:predicted RNA-binding protein YlqC (UPF0109 family)